MTKKQFRKDKENRLINKSNHVNLCSERPEWADYEKEVSSFEKWRENFLKEVRYAVKLRVT